MSAPAQRALLITRAAVVAVTLGAIVSPPLANFSAAIVLCGFFFVPDWRQRMRRTLAAPLGRGVLVFAAALLVAALVGSFGPQGARVALTELVGWRTLLLLLLVFAVFDCGHWKTRLALAFVLFASIAALVSLGAMLSGWHYKDLQPGVVLRNTVTQAMTFAIGAFLAGVLLVTQREAPVVRKVLLGVATGLLLGQLLFLQLGRSGQVLFVVLALVAAALLLRGPRRVVAVAAVPLLAVVAFSVSPLMQSRFVTAWHEMTNAEAATEYSSMGVRVVMWQNTLQLVRARPLLGYGLGGLEPAYAAHVKERVTGWKAIVTDDPHNEFLATWIEAGLVGLLAFVALLVAVVRQPAPQPWRSVALAFLVAWCVTSLVNSHFRTFNEGHLIFVLLGAFLAPAGAAQTRAHAAASTAAAAAATCS